MTLMQIITIIIDFLKSKSMPYVLAVAALALIAWLWASKNSIEKDRDRLSGNMTALMSDLESFKTKSGKDAVKIAQLEVTKGELEKLCADQVNTIKDLNIKLKRVESMNTTATQTSTGGTVQLVDTIFMERVDTVIINHPVKYFEWRDSWNTINGYIDGKNVTCNYQGCDTLNIVVSRVPKKFLFFRFGTKYIEATVVNSNPSTKITYTRQLKIKK